MLVPRMVLSQAILFAGLGVSWCQQAQPTPSPADNTKVNQRDRNSFEAAADQQKDNKVDRDLASRIRKTLVEEESTSTYAHNIKVIVRDGAVTLKGPVKSEN